MTNSYDLIVVGGGSGGLAHAQRAAQYGARVLVIESGRLGGTCVNVGCVPKKVMWYAESMAHDRELSESYGFAPAAHAHDWPRLVAARDAYVERLNGIYARNLANKDIEVISGHARFTGTHTIAVDGTEYRGERITIATGGHPKLPPIPGAELGVTSDGFFELTERPERVLLVGSGYVAVEFAGVMAALGSQTTLMVRYDSVLRSFDTMLQEMAVQALEDEGIELVTHAAPAAARQTDAGIVVDTVDGRTVGPVDCVVWAIGRAPSTADLGLELTGVETDSQGFVVVDQYQTTTAAHIFSLGDVTGAVALTPVAIAAGRRLSDRLWGGQEGRYLDYSNIATVIFTYPPTGTVGMTEAEAREAYGDDEVTVYTSSFIPMKYALGETKRRAAMKLVTVGADERVVGCHVFGDGADEMMQGFAVAIRMGATKRDFDDTVAIHPTSAEELVTMR